MRLNPFAEQVTFSGDAAHYRFVITIRGKEDEDNAWQRLLEVRRGMEEEMTNITKQTLGSEFAIRSVTPIRGSIEILVVVGTTLVAVSKYKNFIDSLELLRRQLEGVIRRYMSPNAEVSSSTTLGLGVPVGNVTENGSFNANIWILGYLILSHAALLVVFIWLVVKKLGTP